MFSFFRKDEKMTRWESKVVTLGVSGFSQEEVTAGLNEQGKKGWEPVTVHVTGTGYCYALLKRKEE